VDQYFGIALSGKHMAALLQLHSKLAKVEDFTVEDARHCATFVAHWLIASDKVDYRQPTVK